MEATLENSNCRWVPPFCNLFQINEQEAGKKNPPYKFRKQAVFHFIEIYLKWKKELDKRKEPHYLEIWLGDPEFLDSQVVAAIRTKIDYYEQLFMKQAKLRPFPYEQVHVDCGGAISVVIYWRSCS
ncbi:hypothetical protein ABEX25_11040 [Paenibacillus thiaminolyticus]|uniref:hypothetical protein n=1 Tax=Paenibacillus thiaminolyticus TaxID=49283 RepID=UPI003D2BC7C9